VCVDVVRRDTPEKWEGVCVCGGSSFHTSLSVKNTV
jgi:hypothetical protein